ncbi:MAG: hypothetical protein AAF514_16610 [Verrucomicrobiota bacterium]
MPAAHHLFFMALGLLVFVGSMALMGMKQKESFFPRVWVAMIILSTLGCFLLIASLMVHERSFPWFPKLAVWIQQISPFTLMLFPFAFIVTLLRTPFRPGE